MDTVIKNKIWHVEEIENLFNLPFNDLLFQAHSIHRQNFDPNEVQMSTLLSIKTGGCPEDCAYCPQSAHYETKITAEDLLNLETVLARAGQAKKMGASRFCMGAAWRSPSNENLEKVLSMVRGVKNLGLETCVTLGMLKKGQAQQLAEAGLDYYNHNLDTDPEFYGEIISTRVYQDRLDTLAQVRQANLKVCCGGIVGMGESIQHRAGLLTQLANLDPPPESVPINLLVKVEGTPLSNVENLDPLDFVRTIAVARITMPKSRVRLSAGRESMPEAIQALCFFAGANSIFYGDKLLTTPNPAATEDEFLFKKLGLHPTLA